MQHRNIWQEPLLCASKSNTWIQMTNRALVRLAVEISQGPALEENLDQWAEWPSIETTVLKHRFNFTWGGRSFNVVWVLLNSIGLFCICDDWETKSRDHLASLKAQKWIDLISGDGFRRSLMLHVSVLLLVFHWWNSLSCWFLDFNGNTWVPKSTLSRCQMSPPSELGWGHINQSKSKPREVLRSRQSRRPQLWMIRCL